MFAHAAARGINKITSLLESRGLHASLNALYQPDVLRLQHLIDEPDRLQLRFIRGIGFEEKVEHLIGLLGSVGVKAPDHEVASSRVAHERSVWP